MIQILRGARWLLGVALLLQSCWIAFCKLYSGADVLTPQLVLLFSVLYYGAIAMVVAMTIAAVIAIVLLVLGHDSSWIVVVYDYITGN